MAQVVSNPVAGLLAFAGGLLAAGVWLWFWLHEDPHPEPKRILFLTFVAGVLAVPIALILEEIIYGAGIALGFWSRALPSFFLLFLWAGVEEVLKYGAAYWAALRKPFFDEPIDAPVYLITAALGFAALENVFMLFNVFQHEFISGFVAIHLRFVGATLLHILTSAIVGFSIAYSFFHPEHRLRNVLWGIFFATLLHTSFNFFILIGGGSSLLYIFSVVWLGGMILILSFEKLKKLIH